MVLRGYQNVLTVIFIFLTHCVLRGLYIKVQGQWRPEYVGAHGSGVQMIMSHLMWVLGIESGPLSW